MAVRDFIRNRPRLAGALAVVAILGAGVAIFVQVRGMGPSGPGNLYYTTDDGKSYFADSALKIPPFDKGGKPAARAHVFECGGKREVGYLSRYTPEAIRALEEAKASRGTGKPPPNPGRLATIGTTGMEVKRPGEATWVKQSDAARATAIRVFRCRDGSTPREVDP